MAELEENRPLEGDRPAQAVIDTRSDPSNGGPVIAVSGEIDMSNVEELEATVASIAGKHPNRVVFELSGLSFMDSAGVAVLLNVARSIDVVLRNPSPAVRRVVELSGLTEILSIEP
jgi:anti-anti-sigma factor